MLNPASNHTHENPSGDKPKPDLSGKKPYMDPAGKNPESDLSSEIPDQIKSIRKAYSEAKFQSFRQLIEENIDAVCSVLDTRWLISVCDTYADHGDIISRRNALLISQMGNFEKLWATYLLMHDVQRNEEKVAKLKRNKVIPLWDGMYSFNINHGDMTQNFFLRLESMLVETPHLLAIYRTVVERMKAGETVLSSLDEYHRRLFQPYPRRSLLRALRKKIRMLLKSYRI